jgi:putative FmdB family regulatory protein
MPLYEYKCLECDKEFIVALSLSERQRGVIVQCPGCNSKKVRQMISPFIAKTASKTA